MPRRRVPIAGSNRLFANTFRRQPCIAEPLERRLLLSDSGTTEVGGQSLSQEYAAAADSATVSGRVWNDLNGNSIRDPGEPAFANVLVDLYSGAGTFITNTTTLGDGTYRFDVPAGQPFYVQVRRPTDATKQYLFALQDIGNDDTIDSDVDILSGRSPTFTLSAQESLANLDIGITQAASIDGYVWYDIGPDGLGVRASYNYMAQPGWVIFQDIDSDGELDDGEPRAVTGADGRYRLDSARPGTFPVTLLGQDGWPTSAPQMVTVKPRGAGSVDFLVRTLLDLSMVSPTSDRVSLYTSTSRSDGCRVAVDAQGNSVVFWYVSKGPQGAGWYGQRMGKDGRTKGSLIFLKSVTVDSVAMDSVGNFVVAGKQLIEGRQRACLQWFGPTDQPLGDPVLVNVGQPDETVSSRVVLALARNGRLVVTWKGHVGNERDRVRARIFDADGQPLGADFLVDTTMVYGEQDPTVAVDAQGGFVIVWANKDSGLGHICGRRFDASGNRLGPSFYVSDYAAEPAVSMAGDGRFVVAWQQNYIAWVQRYNASGVPQGGATPVNGPMDSAISAYAVPSVAMDDTGAFTVLLSGRFYSPWYSTGLFMQRFSSLGLQTRALIRLDGAGDVYGLAVNAGGEFTVVWQGLKTDPASPMRYEIMTQRYQTVGGPDPIIVYDSPCVMVDYDRDTVWIYDPPRVNAVRAFLPMATFPLSSLSSLRFSCPGGSPKWRSPIWISLWNGDPIPPGGIHIYDTSYGELSIGVNLSMAPMVPFPLYVHGTTDLQIPFGQTYSRLVLEDNCHVQRRDWEPDKILRAGDLSIGPNATLELDTYSLIVQSTPENRDEMLSRVTAYLKSARDGGSTPWSGPGFTSSQARANRQMGLAAFVNDKGDGTPLLTSLDGQPLNPGDIVVKATWNGDVNLDGKVDAADYFRIDSGFITQKGGYQNGDLNFDGVVDAADYFLIDSAFIAQGGATLAVGEGPALPNDVPADRPLPAASPFAQARLQDLSDLLASADPLA